MTTATFSLHLVLPDAPGADDACVQRLERLVAGRDGIELAHTTTGGADLCIHYDPDRITFADVERLVRAAGATLSERYGHASIEFRALPGEDAARRLEDELRRVEGVLSASASLPAQRVTLEFDRQTTDLETLRRRVDDAGFHVVPPKDAAAPGDQPSPQPSFYRANRELIWSLCAAGLLAAAWSVERAGALPRPVQLALYVGAYGFGAWDLLRHALNSLRRGAFAFDIDLLMLVAALGAAGLGEWAEGAFLLALFAFAHALEHYAMDRARGAIRALSDLAPAKARVRRDGQDVEVAVEAVRVDEVVLVRPGDRIPVDGVVARGQSAVNQAPVTGESVPVDKTEGAEVFAGTVNGEGALEIRTTRAVGDRTLDRVIRLVAEAQTAKAPTQDFSDRFERVFVPIVLVTAALLAIVPPIVGWESWTAAIYRSLTLLVAASPCALALGTPSAVLAGIAQAARRGVLIKGGAHLENLGRLKALTLDKTGTLTVGRPEVTDLVPHEADSPEALLRVAAAVERQSQHPLAQAVSRAAMERELELPAAGALESVTGKGVRATLGDDIIEIGSARLWSDRDVTIPPEVAASVSRLQAGGRSVMIVKQGERWLGVLGLADQPRPDVRTVLESLRGLGIRPLVMLTGDHRGVGDAVGRELGIDEVRAELMPEDKVTAVQELMARHGALAMVGDGVNDAPALALATVGIAMGGAGTAAALETADVALMGDDLQALPFAIGLSRQAASIIRQNLALSMFVVAALILSSLAGWAGISAVVFLHEGSTMVVVANSLRLLTYSRPQG